MLITDAYKGGNWRIWLTAPPDKISCDAVARRYVRCAAPSIPPDTLDHIVDAAFFNLCSIPQDGQNAVISEDDEKWVWPELEAHGLGYPQFEPSLDRQAFKLAQAYLRDVEQVSLENWLPLQPMPILRQWQRSSGLPAIKRSAGLVSALLACERAKLLANNEFQRWTSKATRTAEQGLANCNVIHAHRLVELTMARLRATVMVSLDWFGPMHRRQCREESDRNRAYEAWLNARSIDLRAEKRRVTLGFVAALGPKWRKHRAARRAFDSFVAQLKQTKRGTDRGFLHTAILILER